MPYREVFFLSLYMQFYISVATFPIVRGERNQNGRELLGARCAPPERADFGLTSSLVVAASRSSSLSLISPAKTRRRSSLA